MSERSDARARGDTHYWTGRPCPKGHVAMRFTSGGNCCECLALKAKSPEKKRYDKAYYSENRERISAREKDAYKNVRDVKIAAAALWAKSNPAKRRAISMSYKSRRRALESAGMSGPELLAWRKSAEPVCYWCGADCRSGFEVDHYVALSKGGTHTADNLVVACPDCNRRKNARDPLEFANTVGRLF